MVNAHEIRVFALRRSGHHGILHWLRGHFTGEVRLQNNVSLLAAGDSHAYNVSADKGDSRDAFIFNVENPDLGTVMARLQSNAWATDQGKSRNVHHLLVLRDPYNRLASRIAVWGRDTQWGDSIQLEMALWKQHAREFLGRTHHLPAGTCMVAYNDWVSREDYRRALSRRMGLEFSDSLLHHIEEAGASSFDISERDAKRLKPLERWKGFLQHTGFLSLLDSETRSLADEIFGDSCREIEESLRRVRGIVVWFTGLPASGKTTLARELEKRLMRSRQVIVLDGDEIRQSVLCAGLGFSKKDRDTNILRIGQMAEALVRTGAIVIVAAVSPYRETRNAVREAVGDFIEVFVDCPLDICRGRDPKGLYAQATPALTGVSDPYEPPLNPEITVDTSEGDILSCAGKIYSAVASRIISP